jgi:hypothetical protein
MIEISLRDESFAHGVALGAGDYKFYPQFLSFNRCPNTWLKYCFFSDSDIIKDTVNNSKSKINIAWLIEPKSINSFTYFKVIQDLHKYDYVLTHNQDLININPNKIIYYPFGGCWIDYKDRIIHDKTNNLSIIASNKNWTYGHNLRHQIINNCSQHINLICGRGYNPIAHKIEALKNYRFSLIIENDNNNYFFTEKLIDCLITGTIPIYYGSNLEHIFDYNGFITIKSLEDFINIVSSINEQTYIEKLGYVKNNFQIAKNFVCTEDWIYNNLLVKNLI